MDSDAYSRLLLENALPLPTDTPVSAGDYYDFSFTLFSLAVSISRQLGAIAP
jgi:hypothetical protein